MYSYVGDNLRVTDELKPLLRLGCCFELRLDANPSAVIRRGVIVAPQSLKPVWYEDISFVGGFSASEQILHEVLAQVPDHLRSRVTVCGIPETSFGKWKQTRVLDSVRLSCGEVVQTHKSKGQDSMVPQKRGRKAVIEKTPKTVKVTTDDLPCDVNEGDMEDLDPTNMGGDSALTVTYHACLDLLRSATKRIDQRLSALEALKKS